MLRKFVSKFFRSPRAKAAESTIENLLSDVPFLRGVDQEFKSNLASEVSPVKYEEGETIFEEGEQGTSFFLIVDGTVSISSNDCFIAELGTGGCFGEGALLTDQIRSATARATQNCTLYKLERESFAKFYNTHKKVRYHLGQIHKQRQSVEIKKSIERNLVEKAPFLNGAGGDLVDELARGLERKQFEEDDILIQEGDEGQAFYLIEEGQVSISKGDEVIAELGSGTCLGEGSLLHNQPCSATVTALTDVSCFAMGKGPFLRIMGRYPIFHKRLLGIHNERKKAVPGS